MIRIFFFIFLVFSLISADIPGQNVLSPESVIVTTDRDVYVAGENILLKTRIFSRTLNSETPSNVCYVLLRDTKNTYCRIFLKTAQNNIGTNSIYIPDTLQTGYYQIVAFTGYMRNFSEELYFYKQILIVNRFDEWLTNLFQQDDSLRNVLPEQPSFKIVLEKDSFKFREKVNVKCLLPPEYSSFKDFTVSVRSFVPYAGYDTRRTSSGNSSFIGGQDLQFPAERDGIYLTGKIVTSGSLPVTGECLFLSTPDSVANLQYTYSNAKGDFSFLLNGYHLGKQLIIKTEKNSNGRYNIVLNDKFKLTKPFVPVRFGMSPELRKFIRDSRNVVRIQKSYGITNVKTSQSASNVRIPYVFNNASDVVRPADFVELENFREISENILTGTRVRAESAGSFLYMMNKADKLYFAKPAAVFVDGVYAYDLKMVLNYNSGSVSKVELLPALRIMGDLTFNGIVSISSANKLKSFDFDPGTCVYSMPSFAGNTTYLSPNYAYRSIKDPMPDLRQLLYWNAQPDVHDIEFYTSDIPGEYLVEVEAVDNDGNIQRAYSTFNVSGQ